MPEKNEISSGFASEVRENGEGRNEKEEGPILGSEIGASLQCLKLSH